MPRAKQTYMAMPDAVFDRLNVPATTLRKTGKVQDSEATA